MSDRQPQFCNAILPHIEMRAFFYRKPKTWRMVVEKCHRDLEARLAIDDAIDDPATADCLAGKRPLQPEPHSPGPERRIDLGCHEDQVVRITIDQVPMIATKLVAHAINETARPLEVDRLLPSNQ
jgi:hypothetical protein